MGRIACESPIGILRQATIANLGKAPQTLQGEERVLDFGSHTGLAPVRVLVGFRQGALIAGQDNFPRCVGTTVSWLDVQGHERLRGFDLIIDGHVLRVIR
mgnify:CR=1 FL=1